jgi:NAD(P)-dependent dehydrogenase (short-subunit alcohol dehydrogenase family)
MTDLGLSVLVNNAGIAWPGQELNEEIAQRTIATNYYGVVNVTMALWNLVKRAHGAIVNISSTMGARALSFMAKPLQDQFLDPKLTLDG